MKNLNLKTIVHAILVIAITIVAIYFVWQLPIGYFFKKLILFHLEEIGFLLFIIPCAIFLGIKELIKKIKK